MRMIVMSHLSNIWTNDFVDLAASTADVATQPVIKETTKLLAFRNHKVNSFSTDKKMHSSAPTPNRILGTKS